MKIASSSCLLSVLLLIVGVARAEQAKSAEAGPVQVTVGAFFNNVPEVSLVDNSVTLDAYIWFRWEPEAWPPPSGRAPDDAEGRGAVPPAGTAASEGRSGPAGTIEVIGSSDGQATSVYDRPEAGYCCVQWKGQRSNFWDVRNYPFDHQEIRLVVEDATFDAREIRYVADTQNSGFSPDLRLPGCRVKGLRTEVAEFAYPTNFGDPAIKTGVGSRYARANFVLTLRRDGWGLFFKLFTALLVSTFVALLAFFINPTQVDPRFGLCVGGLFGIVASGYAVSSMLPETGEVCYADRLHQAGLMVVLLTVAESALSLSLHLNHGERGATIAKRLDRVSFGLLFTGFVAAIVILTARALQ